MPEGDRLPATGKALRELRKAAGVTMYDVAARLEFQESGLSLIEQERKPLPEGFAARFCEVLREITTERAARVADLYPAAPRGAAAYRPCFHAGGRK